MALKDNIGVGLSVFIDDKSIQDASKILNKDVKAIRNKIGKIRVTAEVSADFDELQKQINGKFKDINLDAIKSDFAAKLFDTKGAKQQQQVLVEYLTKIKDLFSFIKDNNLKIDIIKDLNPTAVEGFISLIERLKSVEDIDLFKGGIDTRFLKLLTSTLNSSFSEQSKHLADINTYLSNENKELSLILDKYNEIKDTSVPNLLTIINNTETSSTLSDIEETLVIFERLTELQRQNPGAGLDKVLFRFQTKYEDLSQELFSRNATEFSNFQKAIPFFGLNPADLEKQKKEFISILNSVLLEINEAVQKQEAVAPEVEIKPTVDKEKVKEEAKKAVESSESNVDEEIPITVTPTVSENAKENIKSQIAGDGRPVEIPARLKLLDNAQEDLDGQVKERGISVDIPADPNFSNETNNELDNQVAKNNLHVYIPVYPEVADGFVKWLEDDIKEYPGVLPKVPVEPRLISDYAAILQKEIDEARLLVKASILFDDPQDAVSKWQELQDKLSSSFKSNGAFKSGAAQELIDLYSEYKNLGGSNDLSMLHGQEEQLQKLITKYNDLAKAGKVAVDEAVPLPAEIASLAKSVNELSGAVDTLLQNLNALEPLFNDINFSSLNNVGQNLKDLKISSSYIKNLELLPEKIKAIVDGFETLSKVSDLSGNAIFTQLNDFLSKGEELQNMATILKNYSKADIIAVGSEDSKKQAVLKEQYDVLQANLKQILELYKEINNEVSKKNVDQTRIDADISKIAVLQEQNEAIKNQIAATVESGVKDNLVSSQKIKNAELVIDKEKEIYEAKKSANALDDAEMEGVEEEARNASSATEGIADGLNEANKSAEILRENLKDIKKMTNTITMDASGKITDNVTTITKSSGNSRILDNVDNSVREKTVVVDLAKAYSELNRIRNDVKSFKDRTEQSSQYIILLDQLENKLKEIDQFISNGPGNLSAKEYGEQFTALLSQVQKLDTAVKNVFNPGSFSSDRTQLLMNIYQWMSKNTKAAGAFKEQLTQITDALKNDGANANVKSLAEQFNRLKAATADSGLGGLSSISQYSQSIQRTLGGLITRFLSLYQVIGYLRSSVQTVRELDDALIDLSKTAQMTTKELDDFYLDSSDLARQMGVTTKAIIDQAAAWSRLGYNTAETASQMALLSSKFASISPGMDTDEAQSGLVSVMKAWDVDTVNVEREIMDKINILGNNFAESNADLVTAIEKVGATLAVQGTSIDDALALITGAQEVVQNADIVGTALKTLSLRIRGYDEDTEELSEDVVAATGKVADLTKVASNNFQGISLWTDASQTQYKPLLEYLREISEIWDEIEAKNQTKLLENLFGKRGATVGSSILLNFDQVEAALEQMEESAGSADKEMEKIRNSISYKINDLQQLWVGFIQDTFSRDAIKGAVSGLTAISEVFIKMLQTPGVNVATLAGIGAAIIKIGSASKGAVGGVTKFSTAIRSMFGMATGADSKNILEALNTQIINDTVKDLKDLDKSQAMTVLSTMSLTDAQKVQILSMKGLDVSYSELLAREQAENIQKVLNNSETLKAAVASKTLSVEKAREAIANGECSVAEAALVLARQKNISVAEAEALITTGLSGKVTLLAAKYKALAASIGITTGGLSILLGAVAAVAGVSIYLYKQYKKEKEYVDNLAESVENLVDEYDNQLSTTKKNASSAQSMYDEYKKLADGVDKFGNNQSLANDDFERYKDLSNEIGRLFPNLVSGYTETGDAILKCKDNAAALNEEIEKQTKAAYYGIINGVNEEGNLNGDSVMKNYQAVVDGFNGTFYHTKGSSTENDMLEEYRRQLIELFDLITDFEAKGVDVREAVEHAKYAALEGSIKETDEFYELYTIVNELAELGDELGPEYNFSIDWESVQSWEDFIKDINIEQELAAASGGIDASREEIEKALRDVQKLADAFVHVYEDASGRTYNDLTAEQARAVSQIVSSISEDTIKELNLRTKEDVGNYIDGIISNLLDDTEVSKAIVELFNVPEDATIEQARANAQNYAKALGTALKSGKIQQPTYDVLIKQVDDVIEASDRLNSAAQSLLGGLDGVDAYSFTSEYVEQYDALNKYTENFTLQQAEAFEKWVAQQEGSFESAKDIIDAYEKYLEDEAKKSDPGYSLRNVAEVTDGLDKISSKYDELVQRIEDGASDIDRAFGVSEINSLLEDLGYDLAEDDAKQIAAVLTSGADSGEEMISVLEELATSWVNAKLAVGEYTEEEKQNLKTQLVLAGIAEDVAAAYAENRNTRLKFGGEEKQSILGFSYKNVSEVVDGLSAIKSHYDDLLGRIEDGAVGEELAESITEAIKLTEDLGLDLDDEEVAHLVDTLTSGTASADEMKGALNELATTWAKTTLAVGDYSEAQKQLVSTQLQGAGATKESADRFVEYTAEVGKAREWVAEQGYDLSNMTKAEVVALGQEAKTAGVTTTALAQLHRETLGLTDADVGLEFGTEDATEEIKSVYDNIAEVAEGLRDISSLYSEFVDKVDDGEIGRGLAMEIADIQKLFDKENGLDLGFSDEDIARLTDVLGGGWASETEIEDAFNEIATAWVKASFAAEGYSEDIAQVLITQLKLSGATEESAENFVKAIAAGEEAASLILDNGKNAEAPTFGFSYENLNEVIDGIGQIKAVYDEFEQKVQDGAVGKALAADIEDVVNLFDAENGLKFDLPDEEIARLKEVLTSGNASVEEYREAFNELATAFAKATLASGDFSDIEKEQIATQLENAGMTRESAEAFAALVSELKDAQTATLEYSSALDAIKNASVSFEQNIADVGDGIEKIASLYKDFESKVSDGKIGQELAADMSDVLDLFNQESGLNFGLSDEKIKQLQATLTSGAASAEEMQAAFDELATAWVNASLAAGDYSEEQQQIIATQLEMAGITRESAEEYVQSFAEMQEARQWLIDQGYSLANATDAEVAAMAAEAEAAGISKLALYELRIAELDLSNTGIYTEAVCNEILNIAEACGMSIGALNQLKTSLAGVRAGAGADLNTLEGFMNASAAQDAANSVQDQFGDFFRNARGNLNFSHGGASGGGGGGAKETADAIVSAFEDEYNALKELLDQGKIDQYQYLQYLRALYTKYFRDKKKYLKEYERYEREYLQGMKSMYESAFSYLTKKIDARISELNSQRSAAVAALEAERDAAIAAIDAQIDAIDEQIDAIDDQIDAYNDEIDAIDKANEARQREITLQKALLELNKAQDQRTNLVYSESGGMHYEANRTSLRDVEQQVQEAKDEIEIANIRTKIYLLEDEKEALEDQKEALEKQKEEINKYYDQLIKETEAYYDALIENLEKTKSAIEQILDIEEEAKMRAMLADLGVQDVDALIAAFENGDLSVVEQFKNDYIGILTDMYRENDHMLEELSKVSNIELGELPSYLEKTADGFERIQNLDYSFAAQGLEACKAINEALGGVLEEYHSKGEELGTEVTAGVGEGMNSADAVQALTDASVDVKDTVVDELNTAFDSHSPSRVIAEEVGKDVGAGIGEGMKMYIEDGAQADIQEFVNRFVEIFTQTFKNTFDPSTLFSGEDGVSLPDTLNTLFTDISTNIATMQETINGIDLTPAITAFQSLATIVKEVSEAIGGGGAESGEEQSGAESGASGSGSGSGTQQQSSGEKKGGSGTGLAAAMEEFGSTASEVLVGGEGGEGEGGEGEAGGVVGQFGQLRDAVMEASSAIGMGDDEADTTFVSAGGEGTEAGTLIAAHKALAEIVDDEEVGLPHHVEQWGHVIDKIHEATEALNEFAEDLAKLAAQSPYEIHIIFEAADALAGHAKGTLKGVAHADGTVKLSGAAFAGGQAGLKKNEDALVGELGPEMLIRDGRWSLVGKQGAEFKHLKAGDIILSAQQTADILKTGKLRGRGTSVGGNSHADGTPFNRAAMFANEAMTIDAINDLSTRLVSGITGINTSLDGIGRDITSMTNNISNISNNASNFATTITIGDIHLSDVQNVDGFAKAIKAQLPGKILQELHK